MIKKAIYVSTILILLILAIKIYSNEKSWAIKFYTDNGKNQRRTLIYIKGDNMKLVTKDETYLYNSFSKKTSFINHKNKTYWTGNLPDFRKAVTKIEIQTDNDFLLNDSSFLKNLNTVNKEQLHQIINKDTVANLKIPDYNIYNNFKIISTPNFTSVGKYIVRKYEIRNADKLLEEIWIAENLLPHMGWDMSKFKDFLEVFFFHSGVAPYFNLDSYMKVRKNGLPLKVIIFHEKEKTIITMDHASKTKLNEDSFSIPEDFILTTVDQILTPTTN